MQFSFRPLLQLVSAALALALLTPATTAQPGGNVRSLRGLTPEEAEILSHMSIVMLDDGSGGQCKAIQFSGVNVRIVNGLGSTGTTNCVGNLIVGYNELRGGGDDRTGSHNIVGGKDHNYTRFGGLVVGQFNSILGDWSSVSGGRINTASGSYS